MDSTNISTQTQQHLVQGSVIDNRSQKILTLDQGLFFVLTQTCDIQNGHKDLPYFDLVKITAISKENGNFLNAKSLRKLHVQLNFDGQEWFELEVKNHFKVQREQLDDASSDFTCNDNDTFLISKWWANRFIRTAFPDTFVTRLNNGSSSLADKLKKKLKTHSSNIKNIWVNLKPDTEIDNNEVYTLEVLIHINQDTNQETEQKIKKEILEWMTDKFPNQGINIHELSDVAKSSHINLLDLEDKKEMYYEYLSFNRG